MSPPSIPNSMQVLGPNSWYPKNPASTNGFKGSETGFHSIPDEVLLQIFHFCRLGDSYRWHRQGWYGLTKVCQRWQRIMFALASHLNLRLLFTYQTEVKKELAYFPPLPIAVHYAGRSDPSIEGENVHLALRSPLRVCSIALWASASTLDDLMSSMACAFSVLESISIHCTSTTFTLPVMFLGGQAPRLRILDLGRITVPPSSPWLSSAVGLTTLRVIPSRDFSLEALYSYLRDKPHLSSLHILLLHLPRELYWRTEKGPTSVEPIELPGLNNVTFWGNKVSLESFVAGIRAPNLVEYFLTLNDAASSSPYPSLSQFARQARVPASSAVQIRFSTTTSGAIGVKTWRNSMNWLSHVIEVRCDLFDEQVSSIAQISKQLSESLSHSVELELLFQDHEKFPTHCDVVEPGQWLKVLRPFGKIQTLRVDSALVWQIADALLLDYNVTPTGPGVLPHLQELKLQFCETDDRHTTACDAFRPWKEWRKLPGREPVAVTCLPLEDDDWKSRLPRWNRL